MKTLLVVDVQRAFDSPRWGRRNNPEAEANIARLLEGFRQADLSVLHVKHDSTTPGSLLSPGHEGNLIKDEAQPVKGEPVITKHVNSAFIGTSLADDLRSIGSNEVVVVGFTTDHCVSTTVRMGANLGFPMSVVADATATFGRTGHDGRGHLADHVHDLALTSLHDEFAAIRDTAEVLASLQ